jgi:molecular chaperone DnaK
MKLTRAKFDALTADLVERCRVPFERALADAKLAAQDLDEVILVGGATRTPAVQALVRKLTQGKEPHQGVNPDEVVAVGAAIQAAVLAGEMKDVVLLDVTPLSLGVETLGGLLTKLVERNTTIPVRRSQTFSTADDNQTAVDIHVLQGERELARDNRTLGQFRLEGIPSAPRGGPQIEVAFDIDANGIVNVSAKDLGTGKVQQITVTGTGQMGKDEIERMLREAEAHAAEDRKGREAAETRNAADALAYQVGQRLREAGGQVPVHEKARLEQLLGELQRALKEGADLARIRTLADDLRQAATALDTARGGPQHKTPPGDTDVVDADFREVA